jgi:predicted transposase/invertase (TIGR01784 family)
MSDKKTQELLRIKEKGERNFNSAMKNSRLQGMAKGIAKGKKQTALSMLQDGMFVSTISKYTDLSISEIQFLKSH